MTSQPASPDGHNLIQPAVGADPTDGPYCPDCAYNLRGLTGARCPECGFDLDLIRSAGSSIPWCYRQRLGRLRAFRKTVWQVLRRPRRLWLDLAVRVTRNDAVWFGRVCLVITWASLLSAVAAVTLKNVSHPQGLSAWWDAVLAVGSAAYYGIAIPWLLRSALVRFSLRDLPEEIWQRVSALREYCFAPLALLPIAALLFAIAVATAPARNDLDLVLFLSAGGLVLFVSYGFFSARRNLKAAVRPYFGARRWLRFAGLVGEAVLVWLAVLSVPFVVAWLTIIWLSLR